MKLSWKVYLILFGVFSLSLFCSYLLPIPNLIKVIYSSPAVIALLGILYRLFLDEIQYQKQLAMQKDQQSFEIGTTSHMADILFDKHVNFCEEYISHFQNVLAVLFREGPSEIALTLASELVQIRLKHATWLTEEIDLKLESFEKTLRKIGASAHFYSVDPGGANSAGAVDLMFDEFKNIFDLANNREEIKDKKVAEYEIVKHLLQILRVEELSSLRKKHFAFVA